MKKIAIICANDYPELAFLPNTDSKIIDSEKERIKIAYAKRAKVSNNGIPYIHIHDVEVFEGS